MFLRRTAQGLIRSPVPSNVVALSTANAIVTQPTPDDFRTNETNPSKHNKSHLSRFYTVPPNVRKQIFGTGGFPKKYETQLKTFTECCMMVREPAVEIMDYVRSTNFNKPVNRFVLYGEDGAGKSLTLAHLLHYGHSEGFVLVHVPWVPNWLKRPKEIANSISHEGCVDLPLDGAAWLLHFMTQNKTLLAKLDLRLSKDYVWSKRETTLTGAPLMELIEHGINRAKYSCDVIAALLQELKQQSTQGKLKTMVAIDGFNAFFHPNTRVVTENKVRVTPDMISLTKPFLDITNPDWSNGVCIVTVDRMALTEERMESVLPLYLLRREGFEHLDPFVPVRVDNYSEQEFYSCLQYYLDRKWIQTTGEGYDVELEFLSARNPYTLMKICNSV